MPTQRKPAASVHLLLAGAGVVLHAFVAHGAELALTDLASQLEATERAAASLQTGFTLTVLKAQPVDPNGPWPADGWDDTAIVGKESYEWTIHDGLVRIERLAPGSAPGDPPQAVWVWTGSAWYEKTNGTDNEPGVCGIYAVPPLRYNYNCFPLFNGGVKWTSIIGARSLSDVVRTARLIQRSDENSLVHLRFSAAVDTQIVIVAETEPDLRVASVTLEILGLPESEFSGLVRLRIAYYVEEWAEYDGLLLPKRARKVSSMLRSPSVANPTAKCTIFERRWIERPPGNVPPLSKFTPPPLREGDIVQDYTLRLTYEIGSRRIAIDGVYLNATAPILDRVTTDLPKILGPLIEEKGP